MFYTKKLISTISFTFIFILQTSNNNCMNHPLPKTAMSEEMLKIIGNIGLRALNNEKTKQAALTAVKNGSKWMAIGDTFFGATGCAYSIWTLGKDVKSYIAPNDEQKAHALAVEEMLELHKSKKYLENCLINNAHDARGISGRPKICEKEARRFAMAAGEEKLNEITATFNNYYRK